MYFASEARRELITIERKVIQLAAPRTTGWTGLAAVVMFAAMIRRRSVFDPLEPTKEPRWYVVRDNLNRLLEARVLPAGSDLKRVFVAAMLERIDAGWQLGEFSSRGGSVFFTRGVDRCIVGIEAADPGQTVGYGAAHLTESPGRDG